MKSQQERFHALNKQCNDLQAKVQKIQDKCLKLTDKDGAKRDKYREEIRALHGELLPLASERSQIVKALKGKTGKKA